MALIIADVGELLLMEWAIRSTSTPENLTLKLYSNNYVPLSTSVAGSFTTCTFSGYIDKTLTRSLWNAPTTDANFKAEIVYSVAQTWNATSSQTVYGYFIVGATSGTLVYAERFASSRPVVNGDSLTITPKITGKSEN